MTDPFHNRLTRSVDRWRVTLRLLRQFGLHLPKSASSTASKEKILGVLGALFLALLFGGESDASWQATAISELDLTVIWSTTGEGTGVGPLVSVTGIAESPAGEIWVSDARRHTIVAFTPLAETARVIATEGQGPGEVQGPLLIASASGGKMAIYDGVGVIHLFTSSGTFSRRIQLRVRFSFPKSFIGLEPGHFIIAGALTARPASLHLIAPDGAIVQSWGPAPSTGNVRADELAAGGALAMLKDGSVLFSQAAPHRLMIYPISPATRSPSRDGDIVAENSSLLTSPTADELIVEGLDDDGQWYRRFNGAFPQSRGVFVLPNEQILNIIVFAAERRSIWQIFDGEEWDLVAEKGVGEAYRPWAITSNGDILATFLDRAGETQIVRLRVDFAEDE